MGIEQSISRIVNSGSQIGQAASPMVAASGHPEIAVGLNMAPMAMQAMGMGAPPASQPSSTPPQMQRPMPSPQQPGMGMAQPLPPIAHRPGQPQLPPQVFSAMGIG